MKYQTKALEIQHEVKAAKDQVADTLCNLGIIYFFLLIPQMDRALDCCLRALNIYKELNMNEDVCRCYDSIGEVYLNRNRKI